MTVPLKTFDQVWEDGEQIFKDEIQNENLDSILKELELKLGLYRILASKSEVPVEDMNAMKIKTMGEILLTMTELSLFENINVHAALKEAVLLRTIDREAEKHGVKN